MGVESEAWASLDVYAPSRPQIGSYKNPVCLDDDEDASSMAAQPTPRGRKRKAADVTDDPYMQYASTHKPRKRTTAPKSTTTELEPPAKSSKPKTKAKARTKKTAEPTEEKRLRRYRPKPPATFQEIANRALTQRFCILNRKRTGTEDEPAEEIEVAGTTGNVYTVEINRVPSCDCPHALKGNQCKHIIYVLMRTLKARSELSYQLALTTSELKGIFAAAPPLPSEVAASSTDTSSPDEDPNRKALDDDCPICYDSFTATEKAVWCKDGCGNNIHSGCFEKWATQKKATDGKVTCPFCRALWREDDIKLGAGAGSVNAAGYRNVAQDLGLSGEREYSTYHSYWVQRQRRAGLIDDGGYDYC